jgi:sec-independent protein translocase protein TatA
LSPRAFVRQAVAASWNDAFFNRSEPHRNEERLMIEGLFQPGHLLLILVVALFLFGPKKLPELGKSMAEGIRNFKEGVTTASELESPKKPE